MTAVEIFFNDLVNQGFIEYKDDSLVQNIFNAAKQMEKQQIIDAYKKGYMFGMQNRNPKSEEYYNETYKKE
jgi:hypothetical protein